jgi:hypothetical protein
MSRITELHPHRDFLPFGVGVEVKRAVVFAGTRAGAAIAFGTGT